jgi:hypothetical protein
MCIDSLIESILLEAIEYPGPVGLDLEFLVRTDAVVEFARFTRALGWKVKADFSVSTAVGSLEDAFYAPVEIDTGTPLPMKVLVSGLAKILAWLKHKDLISYDTLTHDILGPFNYSGDTYSTAFGSGPDSRNAKSRKLIWNRTLKLARGRTTSNLSAGCHIHFDINTWFVSADHIERFIGLFYKSKDQIKGQVLTGRYDGPESGGNIFADFEVAKYVPGYSKRRGKYKFDTSAKGKTPADRGMEVGSEQKYRALNFSHAKDRGDVEVRVFHSSLNLFTILHWFDLIAKMIDYSKSDKRKPDWQAFSANLYHTEPQLRKDFTKRSQKVNTPYGKPTELGPGQVASKAVAKILGTRSNYKNVEWPEKEELSHVLEPELGEEPT